MWPGLLTCCLHHPEIWAARRPLQPRSLLTRSIWPTAPETTRTSLHNGEFQICYRLEMWHKNFLLLWVSLGPPAASKVHLSPKVLLRTAKELSWREAVDPPFRSLLPLVKRLSLLLSWVRAHFLLSLSHSALPYCPSASLVLVRGNRVSRCCCCCCCCLYHCSALHSTDSHSADYWSISSHSSFCSPPFSFHPSPSGWKISWLADSLSSQDFRLPPPCLIRGLLLGGGRGAEEAESQCFLF